MSAVIFPLAADERDREKDLAARFVQLWSTASGDPRTVYDTFISATPVRLEVRQGMHHVFQVDVAHLRTSGVALDRAAAFLVDASANR
jgi:hypothetical protein